MTQKMTQKKIKSGILMRAATVGAVDQENRTFELAFSSEEPYERYFGVEILDHGKGSVDLSWISSGRAPLLAEHNPDNQIGVIENARIDKDRVGRAVVRCGKSALANEYFQDVVDGIRQNISVGYRINKMILEEENIDKPSIYRVIEWQPLEISVVSIPADKSVGIGRSRAEEENDVLIEQTNQPQIEENTMTNPAIAAEPNNAATQVDIKKELDAARKNETERMTGINTLAIKHNVPTDKAAEFIKEGRSVDQFREFILDRAGNPNPINPSNGNIGLKKDEAKRFSILKAVRAQALQDWSEAGYEREIIQETVRKSYGRKFRGNIQVPLDVLVAQRDLTIGTSGSPGGGYYSVGTEIRPQDFISLLRNKMLVRKLGAKVLSGLEGNISIPKQTAAGTAYWVTEGNAPTESQQTIGQVALTAKTVGAYTEITRQLMLQSSLDAENFVLDDLASILALAIDKASIDGSGSSGQPTGIINQSGINTVTITSGQPSFANMVALETEVAADNADMGSLAYLMNPTDRGYLKTKEKASSTAQFVYTDNPSKPGVGMVNGYDAHATKQTAADTIIFGNWADLIIGEWGVLDLLVNPFALDTSGGVRIRAMQDVDIAVRNAGSFAKTVTA